MTELVAPEQGTGRSPLVAQIDRLTANPFLRFAPGNDEEHPPVLRPTNPVVDRVLSKGPASTHQYPGATVIGPSQGRPAVLYIGPTPLRPLCITMERETLVTK